MKHLIFTILLTISPNCFSQTVEVVERSISVCYMNDSKRSDVVAVTKAETELLGLEILAYFDCSSPVSGPCDQLSIGRYKPNSISVNDITLNLGEQLNGNHVSAFNLGRFFSAEDYTHKFLIFEMADVDCPNMPDKYCYIVLCLDSNNQIVKHVLYNKENNPIMEDELSTVIGGMKKNVLKPIRQETEN